MRKTCENINDVLNVLKDYGFTPYKEYENNALHAYYMNYDEVDTFTIYMYYSLKSHSIIFRAIYPRDVPNNQLNNALEFIALFNEKYSFNTLEINEKNNNLISFRTAFDFTNVHLSDITILKLVSMCAAGMRSLIPYLDLIGKKEDVQSLFNKYSSDY